MTDTANTALRCRATKADGSQCGQTTSVSPETGVCIWHDPVRAEEAKAARAKGGEGKRRTHSITVSPEEALPPPKTIEDAVEWSSWAVHAVTTGKIDSRTAREISGLLTTFRHGVEKSNLARRMDKVQADLDALRGKALK